MPRCPASMIPPVNPAIQEALAFYGHGDFAASVLAHLERGRVICGPGFLLLGRAVPRNAPEAEILNLERSWTEAECDAWFVWWASGSLKEIARLLPFPKPWLGFHRRDAIRWYPLSKFLRTHGKQTLSTEADCAAEGVGTS